MPKGKGYKEDKFDKPSYANLLTLRGLKATKEIKSAFKEVKKRGVGKTISGAVSHAKRTLKRKLGKSKPQTKKPLYSTTRTEAIDKAVGDVAGTKQYQRMKGKPSPRVSPHAQAIGTVAERKTKQYRRMKGRKE